MSLLLEDSGFWISIVTLVLGFCSGSILMLYRSKCQSLTCCCFEMHRNVEVELQDHALENQMRQQNIV